MTPADLRDARAVLGADELKLLLRYEPDTGLFFWLPRPDDKQWSSRHAHKQAGDLSRGYVRIRVNKQGYKAHRLAWLFVTGEYPPDTIDHIDGDRENNRLTNLRPATYSQNMCNTGPRATNKTGAKGVYFDRRASKYRVDIKFNGIKTYVGHFPDLTTAQKARAAAAESLHKGFARNT